MVFWHWFSTHVLVQQLLNSSSVPFIHPSTLTVNFPTTNAIPCLRKDRNPTLATLEDVITCFDEFSVSEAFYNQTTYDSAQPTGDELTAWAGAIDTLLRVDGNCSSVRLPELLDGPYAVSSFTESASTSHKSFCVLSESRYDTNSGYYVKGWGLVIVPAARPRHSRNLHFAAPHPVYDMDTPTQAAALFKRTGAKSLLVAGRMRTAFKESTTCVQPRPRNGPYWKTDPTHDKNDPFFHATKAIRDWQFEQGGCPSESCAFIQIHGKGVNTCKSDTVFMSTGLGRSPSSIAWYNSSVTSPIRRLQKQLRRALPAWNISSPLESSCGLVATTNVVGRLLNGICEEHVCLKAADASTVSGHFIHLEQSRAARAPENYDYWAEALRHTFITV